MSLNQVHSKNNPEKAQALKKKGAEIETIQSEPNNGTEQQITLETSEIIHLKQFFKYSRFGKINPIKFICDNQAIPVFHQQTLKA